MTNKALLCGINNYKSQTDLRGCINDIESMSRLLVNKFDFKTSNIHKLTDERVTKANLKKEWQWLLENVTSGDYLVFHFSGHGSYVPDEDREESDGYDEITCLYDMDFYNERTFFRDDEWNEAIQQVPLGVKLIVVMDTCHSGTGTRMLSVNMDGRLQRMSVNLKDSLKKGQGREALRLLDVATASSELFELERYRQLLNEKNIVVNRFLPPPPELQERIVKTARTKALSTPGIKKGTHLLLAACQDDQTSADAYIDGDFHGAFTYYFCQAIEQFPKLGTKELIERVTQQLEIGGFTQKPQHEGENLPSPIFSHSPSIKLPDLKNMTSKTNISAENQKLLIEAYIKLLDTIGGTEEVETAGGREIARNRYLVYVHGISQHRTGYSEPWWKALKPHVGRVFGDGNLDDTRREVIWSDLVNARDIHSIDEEKKEQLRREIENILEDRRRKEIAISSGGKRHNRQAIAPVIERGDGKAIDDFLIYMVDSRMRQRIIDRFTKTMTPL
jgi:metacaspase-1